MGGGIHHLAWALIAPRNGANNKWVSEATCPCYMPGRRQCLIPDNKQAPTCTAEELEVLLPCRIKELLLAGCELEAEDHMGLAAMLKWGQGPLTRLDLSHNALSGVSAQCLLRQINALQPAPQQRQADTATGVEAGIQALIHLGAGSAGEREGNAIATLLSLPTQQPPHCNLACCNAQCRHIQGQQLCAW
jgi:hypothetical protein